MKGSSWSPKNRGKVRLCAVAPESGDLLSLEPGYSTVRHLAAMPKGSGRISGIALNTEGGMWTALCDG